MKILLIATWVAALLLTAGTFHPTRPLDELRGIKRGAEVPAFIMTTIDDGTVDSRRYKGKTLILIYLSAEQRNSERAAVDAELLVKNLQNESVKLLFVTADVVYKSYFEKIRKAAGTTAPLAFDGERKLYGKLGLIVFPTTLVINEEGRLAHVISTRGSDYAHTLECYVRHTLGEYTDEQLGQELTARSFDRGSPKSLAARHRAAARLLRDKGLLQDAEKELRTALDLDPASVHIQLDIADLCISMGKIDECSRIVDHVLKTDPRQRRAKSLKGIALFKNGELDAARSMLTDALILNPDPARTHYYLGRILEAKDDKDGAIEHYREALMRLLGE